MSRLPKQDPNYQCQLMSSAKDSALHQKGREAFKKDIVDLLKTSQSFLFVTVGEGGATGRICVSGGDYLGIMVECANRLASDMGKKL